jgi:RHS repeat-associated protein
MAGISSKAAGKLENKNKYNGIEHNTDFDLNIYDAFYRNLDPQIGRFWQQDPKSELNGMESVYNSMGNNPIVRIDPLGDDWYSQKDENGNESYKWFEGSGEQKGWSNVGEYLVLHYFEKGDGKKKADKESLLMFHQTTFLEDLDLNSDRGAKFKMLLSEGGFVPNKNYGIDKTGRGVKAEGGGGQRETLFGLALISATIDNRFGAINNPLNSKLNLSKHWGKGDSFSSLFLASQYNGVMEAAYTDFNTWFNKSLPNAGRTKRDIFTLIGDAYKALDNPGLTLSRQFNFNGNRAFSYAHNEAGTQLFNGQSVSFNKTKTLIQVLNTRADIK